MEVLFLLAARGLKAVRDEFLLLRSSGQVRTVSAALLLENKFRGS